MRELSLLRPTLRSLVVLGGYGWQAALPAAAAAGWSVPRPRPAFAHGARTTLTADGGGRDLAVFGCYHVSQRNTFTGRLTPGCSPTSWDAPPAPPAWPSHERVSP